MCIFLRKLDMVYVHVHYELALYMITFLPQQPHIYDLTQENPFSWMMRTLNASSVSNMLLVEHASNFQWLLFQAPLQPK